MLRKTVERRHQAVFFAQGQQGRADAREIPLHDIRLLIISIAAAGIGMVGHMAAVESIHKAERAVIDGQPQHRHIVGIQHAVGKAHRLPVGHQAHAALANGFKQGQIRLLGAFTFGIMVFNQKIGQRRQILMLAGVIKIFKMAEADKARRDTGNHRSGFLLLAIHRIITADNRQRAGGRNAQAVYRFGTQILTNAGTQYRPAVGKARKRRFARPFELPFPAYPLFILPLTQH